jgi:thiol-disulfide isomerase/thioredoxin
MGRLGSFGALALGLVTLGLFGCQQKDLTDRMIEQAVAKETPKPKEEAVSQLDVDPTGFVPGPAPKLSFATLSGKKVSLADYKGKVVLIDFWATWCPPCRKGLPFTDRLNKELRARGLQVMAVSNEEPALVKSFIKHFKFGFDVFLDHGEGMEAFMSTGLPTTMIIDRNGNVVAKEVGLAPQSVTLANLAKAGLDVNGVEPKDDPVAG